MYKTVRKPILALLALCVAGIFSSCVNPKELVYMQGIEETPSHEVQQNYEVTIQKDDKTPFPETRFNVIGIRIRKSATKTETMQILFL